MDVLHTSIARVDSYPQSKIAWYACAVLTVGCALAFLDRGIITLFIVPIQRDLGLTDTQISLLVGLAFGVFNAIFGLPLARWIDKGRRTMIAACGILAWSIATAACGVAGNFWQLFAARMAVGVGESTVMPSGVSLLADLFPPSRRAAAMGTFYSGIYIGSGCAFLVGGLLWRLLGDRLVPLPLIGAFHSWQVILLAVGAAGLLLAPLTLFIREPKRLEGGVAIAPVGLPIPAVARFYRSNARTMIGHSVGFCLQNFPLHAGAVWLATMAVRTLGWSITQAGAIYGIMMLVLGPAGSASAGLLADWMARRGRTDGKLIICIGAALATALGSAVLVTHPSSGAVVGAIGFLCYFGPFVLPLAPGALQDIVPNAMRGQATAIYVGAINVVSGSIAPTSVALLTDYVFHDKAMVGVSLGIVGVTASCAAALVLYFTLKPFRRSAEALGGTQSQLIDSQSLPEPHAAVYRS